MGSTSSCRIAQRVADGDAAPLQALPSDTPVFDALLFIAVLSPYLDTFAKDSPLWEQR